MNYLNFYPGSIEVSDQPAYAVEDVVGFATSVIRGCTSSTPVDGALDATEDGSIWADLCAKYGDDAVQGVIEEIHAVLS
jgi:hypothetical protein